ncbi:hypothetical protein HPP92_026734 [Vanilla planifolia]|uniref:Uncharacterized protein n=1 Tax=Vanilla planifolia TaxID=51239 RepID=A0A835PDK6_VANPL|nr:hypothetical protein HPP92_026734 [Vanilla planifolia]
MQHGIVTATGEETMSSEGHKGIKTVECLRGRLLAERLASKAAKADADRLAKRLVDLEALLQEELQRRERAEKRMKLLLKRLKSVEEEWDRSDTSVRSSSPVKCCFSNGRFGEWNKLGQCGYEGHANGSSYCASAHQLVSQNKEPLQGDGTTNGGGSKELFDGVLSKSSSAKEEKQDCNDDQTELYYHEENVALVPVSILKEPTVCSNKDAVKVLVSLRHVRKQLQSLVGSKVAR